MKRKTQQGASSEEPMLQELIDAARADVPTDAQWENARARLKTRLAAGAPPGGRGSARPAPESAPRPLWRRIRIRPAAVSFSALVLICAIVLPLLLSTTSPTAGFASGVTAGELRIVGAEGETTSSCTLRHTSVEASITGFVSRTIVRQTFENPLPEKIEAVYVFPLPSDSAVDSMVILIGDRRIVGAVKPREEARATYEAARSAGKVAALLDQERPNIFTQSVANIGPGARVEIEISYVETLKLEDGSFEYSFPMTVAPRYIPGALNNGLAAGTAPNNVQVPDASRITPPVAVNDSRSGHDVDVQVFLEAGSEIFEVTSPLHEVDVERDSAERAIVSLKNRQEIPNKDFILRYRTASDSVRDAFLSTTTPRGSFFMLALQPPRRVTPESARPKEMIFVIDRSGSMNGSPIDKAKETMRLCIESMNPSDTFNLLSFSGGMGRCFPSPQHNMPENRQAALQYLNDLTGDGGTEMMPAIMESLSRPADPDRVRIVVFMTDGHIGNDYAIIDAVKKNVATSRVFAFGIGQSVNRFLLDAMAREGRGEVQYVTLQDSGQEAAVKFHQRIGSPVLTDIQIDWGNLPVAEVNPTLIPDLFAEKPIVITGRLKGEAAGEIVLRGNTADGAFERRIAVTESTGPERRDAIDTLWARARVGRLMGEDLQGMQSGTFNTELRDEVTSLGVQFGLMTPFTSFVAVEETASAEPGEPRTVKVPAEIPDGMAGETAGNKGRFEALYSRRSSTAYTYDPTNGTVSQGDVHRVNQGPDLLLARRGLVPVNAAPPEATAQALPASVGQPDINLDGLPDIIVGDKEDIDGDGRDNNFFVFKEAFRFEDQVTDAVDSGHAPRATSPLSWDFSEKKSINTSSAYLPVGAKAPEATVTLPFQNRPQPHLEKLAPHLRDLEQQVDSEGNLTSGTITVARYMIEVRVSITGEKEAALKALAQAGFIVKPSTADGYLIGLADVRKLGDLALLPVVVRIE